MKPTRGLTKSRCMKRAEPLSQRQVYVGLHPSCKRENQKARHLDKAGLAIASDCAVSQRSLARGCKETPGYQDVQRRLKPRRSADLQSAISYRKGWDDSSSGTSFSQSLAQTICLFERSAAATPSIDGLNLGPL